MAVEVLMPKLGATMEKARIIQWFKQEGDSVQIGEPILEIMTDKINMEVEATNEGILIKKLYEEDTEVPVLDVIAYIGETDESIEEKTKEKPALLCSENKDHSRKFIIDTVISTPSSPELKVRRTPAALKLAQIHGIDLRRVKGTGAYNRIHVQDVELYIKSQKNATSLAEKIAIDQNINLTNISSSKIGKEDVLHHIPKKVSHSIPYNGIRKVVGDRMVNSVNQVPHVTLNTEVDMTKASELRSFLLDKIQKKTGLRLSYTEIIVKSVAHALSFHPMMNASLNGNQIDMHSEINIGLAVAIPNGLVVPVITNADQLGLAELTVKSKKLAKLARENRLSLGQMQSGTFTISNLGMYAVDSFTPIINQPESAILGVGRVKEQVVSINGAIEVRPQMSLSLSFDHRVVDGAPAAHFLTDLKNILENPYELFI